MRSKLLIISFLLCCCGVKSQHVSAVYKIDGLLNRLKHKDTLYVVNFWATWCKPCIKELPAFDSLLAKTKSDKIKILLVCLDFKEELEKKVNPFLAKNQLTSECVLLDEINGNDFIDKVSRDWTGAIPATLLRHGEKSAFLERKITLSDLEAEVSKLR